MLIRASFSTLPSPLKWRRAVAQRTLAAQLSSFLLHRKNALSLLRSKFPLLPLPFPSSLLRRILSRTHYHPEVSLRFFLFARSHLSFSPNLYDISAIVSILVSSDHFSPALKHFSSTLLSYPHTSVLNSLLCSSSSFNISQSKVLSFALELYCKLSSTNAMEAFKRMRNSSLVPSSRSFNSLLEFLSSTGEIHTSWPVCAVALRLGTKLDDGSWTVLVRLLLQEGKLQRAEMLLSSGFGQRSSNYDLIVDCYASRREFTAAICLLNGMEARGFTPMLSTLSSILDESCRFGDLKMAGLIMKEMVVMDLLPMAPSMDFDWIIRRFCELGKTFAAKLIFEKAWKVDYGLESAAYASMLLAFTQRRQTNEAMKVFDIMSQRGVSMDPQILVLFASDICSGEPSEEIDSLIKNSIRDGFLPEASDLSRYVTENCNRGRWKVATELLDLALDRGIMVDASCCCSMIKHFCSNGFLDSAIDLQRRVKGLGGGWLSSDSYNALLEALVMGGRAAESIGIFDCMRKEKVLTSFSFVIMIRALCREKELRKAMNLHDEMLKLRLKPDAATYKRLISGFQ